MPLIYELVASGGLYVNEYLEDGEGGGGAHCLSGLSASQMLFITYHHAGKRSLLTESLNLLHTKDSVSASVDACEWTECINTHVLFCFLSFLLS